MPTPPRAARRPVVREHHGHRVEDPYDWLRDGEDPEVLAHLAAENAYAEAMTAHLAPLREAVFEEIRSRVQETDMSVPASYRSWWYYSRTFEGQQYSAQCRAPVVGDRPRPKPVPGVAVEGEQVLLDGNVEAAGHEFFALGDFEISHDGDRLAYSVDVAGDESYDLRVKDVTGGVIVDDAVTGIGTGLVWSLDNRHLFYTRLDDAWRPYQVWRHEVGTAASGDVLVFQEDDERFWAGVGSSRDDRWITVGVASRTTSETWLLDASTPTEPLRCVAPRRDGVEYDVEPATDRLVITHNADLVDFSVSQAPLTCTSAHEWVPLLQPVEGERVLGVDAYAAHLVVSLRRDGLSAMRVVPRDDAVPGGFGPGFDLVPDEALYGCGAGNNPDYETRALQVVHESMVTPMTVSDVDLDTRTWTLLKRQPVHGYDPDAYAQQRDWVTAADGTRVPVSLVYRRDAFPGGPPDGSRPGTAPGLLYGYGAYESSSDPWFSVLRLSLLDRGFVYAVAHVRGGGELGRHWYLDGRLEHKQHSFSDFVACADRLVEAGWVAPDRLVAYGGSAGGLLVAAAANQAPARFRAVYVEVPFVDALTTMLDPGLPLTVVEQDEWGDPLGDPAAYEWIAAYSPYDNVVGKEYPAVLATTSLNDMRVSFAEPAKWVQRLRDTVTSDPARRPVLLRTQLVSGHGGRSGRYDDWRDQAWEYAFLIDQVGASEGVSAQVTAAS